MIQRILAATDFSPSADEAWRCAVDLARSLDADLHLVHVAMPMPGDAPQKVDQDYEHAVALTQRLLEERAGTPTLGRRPFWVSVGSESSMSLSSRQIPHTSPSRKRRQHL